MRNQLCDSCYAIWALLFEQEGPYLMADDEQVVYAAYWLNQRLQKFKTIAIR